MKMQLDTDTSALRLGRNVGRSAFIQAIIDAQTIDPITGMRAMPRDPFICFAENDGGEDGGGDDDGGEKKYTKADVEKMIKARLKKAEKEQELAAKRAEDAEKQLSDLTKKVEGMQAKLDETGKSDTEKELAKLQRELARANDALTKANQERDEAVAKATEAVGGLTKTKLEGTLREALRAHKAHGKGMDQAVRLMLADGASFDEDGNFVMKVGDVPFDKPEEAAKKWLEANPHFVEGSGGAAGTPRNGGSRIITTQQMDEMSPGALIATGLKSPPIGGAGQ